VYPDVDQAVRFHHALLAKLGIEAIEPVNETRLKTSLDRAKMAAEQQRGDIITLATMLLYGLIRDEPFGPASAQTGMALTLAFLLRNGVALYAPEEEITAVGVAVSRGELFVGMLEPWMRECARSIQRG
jgi:prophage maintenance system killer protein